RRHRIYARRIARDSLETPCKAVTMSGSRHGRVVPNHESSGLAVAWMCPSEYHEECPSQAARPFDVRPKTTVLFSRRLDTSGPRCASEVGGEPAHVLGTQMEPRP